jgi:hypothetical protein
MLSFLVHVVCVLFSAATNLFYCAIVRFVTPLLEAVAKEQHNNNRLSLSLSDIASSSHSLRFHIAPLEA